MPKISVLLISKGILHTIHIACNKFEYKYSVFTCLIHVIYKCIHDRYTSVYMTDMVPVLYNFVKVDTETFLSDPKHVDVIITMCKSVSAVVISDV